MCCALLTSHNDDISYITSQNLYQKENQFFFFFYIRSKWADMVMGQVKHLSFCIWTNLIVLTNVTMPTSFHLRLPNVYWKDQYFNFKGFFLFALFLIYFYFVFVYEMKEIIFYGYELFQIRWRIRWCIINWNLCERQFLRACLVLII